jgi:hypothetical protein
MHILRIVGYACHEPAHGIPGKETDCKTLDVRKEPHAQIVHDSLTGVFHDEYLRNSQQKGDKDQNEKPADGIGDSSKIIRTELCDYLTGQFIEVLVTDD